MSLEVMVAADRVVILLIGSLADHAGEVFLDKVLHLERAPNVVHPT